MPPSPESDAAPLAPPLAVPTLRGIGTHEAARGQDFPPHHHPEWELVFYLRGFIEVPVGSEVHRTRPGLLLLTPPHTTHAERATTGYANIFASYQAEPSHPWPRVALDDAHGSLAHLFTTLLREQKRPTTDSPAMIEALSAQLDILLQRVAAQSQPTQAELLVRGAEMLWEAEPGRHWRIETTARSLGASLSQLRADFALVRGQPPTEILRAIRLRHALALLAASGHPLETIAHESGFHSASHLSRHIKTYTGQTPGKWRAGKFQLPR